MKNIKHIASLIAVALMTILTTGCNDFLDKQPLDSIKVKDFWKSEQDAELWLLGMYDEIQNTLGSNYFIWGESRSDNIVQCGTGTYQLNYLQNTLTSSLEPCNWDKLYRAISSANLAIKYFNRIPKITPEKLDLMLGEAYAARALMYFYAIRVWGAVPLITEPYEGLSGQKKFYERSPVNAIKEQIEKDITIASRMFAGSATTVFRLNAGSMLALKADLHMWFKEYDLVIEATDDLYKMKRYDLAKNATEWKSIFDNPQASTESIFSLRWDAVTDSRNGIYTFLSYDGARYKIRRELWNSLISRKTDSRLLYMTDTVRMWYINNKRPITEECYDLDKYISNFNFNKFARYNPAKPNSDVTGMPAGGYDVPSLITYMPDIPIYRYSDIALMRAEALNMRGRSSEARDIVNSIRKRIGYCYMGEITDPENPDGTIKIWINEVTAQNTPDGDALQTVILEERQLELWGEGKRWFDLVRTDNVKKVMDPILKDYGYADGFGDIRRILFPLHSSVFEANHLLYQNEPYSQQ